MRFPGIGSGGDGRRVRTASLVSGVVVVLVVAGAAAAGACPFPGKGVATITASFADSCRDVVARSSKDISFVAIHYADGRVVKDETVGSRDFALDGAPGDEIAHVVVKSATTRQRFDCTASNAVPTAAVEARGLREDDWVGDGTLFCGGAGLPDPNPCLTFRFRGTNSSDPDNDIATWSIDFGDGTSATGSWSTEPPADVAHAYPGDGIYAAVLTVTDAAGQTSSDTISVSMDTDGGD
jgi:hypothetical protein